jgi:hypothetical protein
MAGHPDYLTDADELPHPPADEPLWSESYLVQGYDPVAGVGFFTHLNRTEWDVELWNDVFVVYLPDDRFVVAKGYGLGDDSGPQGGGTKLRMSRPWSECEVLHRGGAQLASGSELREGGLPDGRHIGLEVELSFSGHGPAFDLGNIDEPPVGHAHYEQHGRLTGTIRYGEETITFAGTGLRDHTWGPRDLTFLGRHVWHHGLFPSGRWFSVAEVRTPREDGVMIQMANVGDAAGVTPSRLLTAPALLDAETDAFSPFAVTLQTPDGPTEITGEILQPMTFSWVGVNEMALGADRRTDPSHRYFECQTRLEWNGEVGYGLSERTVYLR